MSIQQQKTDVHKSPGGVDLRQYYYIILSCGGRGVARVSDTASKYYHTSHVPGPIHIVCTSTNCHQGHLTRGYTLSYQKRKAIPTSAASIMNQRYWQILLCIAKVKGNWKRSIEAKYPSYTSFCSKDRRRGIVLTPLQLPRGRCRFDCYNWAWYCVFNYLLVSNVGFWELLCNLSFLWISVALEETKFKQRILKRPLLVHEWTQLSHL